MGKPSDAHGEKFPHFPMDHDCLHHASRPFAGRRARCMLAASSFSSAASSTAASQQQQHAELMRAGDNGPVVCCPAAQAAAGGDSDAQSRTSGCGRQFYNLLEFPAAAPGRDAETVTAVLPSMLFGGSNHPNPPGWPISSYPMNYRIHR